MVLTLLRGLSSREHLRSAGGYKIGPIIESIAASRTPYAAARTAALSSMTNSVGAPAGFIPLPQLWWVR
jgi:hypothetical protein